MNMKMIVWIIFIYFINGHTRTTPKPKRNYKQISMSAKNEDRQNNRIEFVQIQNISSEFSVDRIVFSSQQIEHTIMILHGYMDRKSTHWRIQEYSVFILFISSNVSCQMAWERCRKMPITESVAFYCIRNQFLISFRQVVKKSMRCQLPDTKKSIARNSIFISCLARVFSGHRSAATWFHGFFFLITN